MPTAPPPFLGAPRPSRRLSGCSPLCSGRIRKNRLSAIGITLRRCIFRSRTGRFCLLQPSSGQKDF